MRTADQTFRYTHIFKHLGVLYFIFLFIVSLLSFFARDRVILTALAVTIAVGLLLLALFLKSSIHVSRGGIVKKSLLGTSSLTWKEIRKVSSQGPSLRLEGGSASLSIHPHLYGATEIFDLIYAKRPDLFDSIQVNRLVRGSTKSALIMAVGLLLLALALLLYFYRDYLFIPGLLGILFCVQAVGSWFLSPHSLTLENNRLTLHYFNRSVSYSANDIAAIQPLKTPQDQFRSVVIVFQDQKTLNMSGFQGSPFIAYLVLKRWHEKNATNQVSV